MRMDASDASLPFREHLNDVPGPLGCETIVREIERNQRPVVTKSTNNNNISCNTKRKNSTVHSTCSFSGPLQCTRLLQHQTGCWKYQGSTGLCLHLGDLRHRWHAHQLSACSWQHCSVSAHEPEPHLRLHLRSRLYRAHRQIHGALCVPAYMPQAEAATPLRLGHPFLRTLYPPRCSEKRRKSAAYKREHNGMLPYLRWCWSLLLPQFLHFEPSKGFL